MRGVGCGGWGVGFRAGCRGSGTAKFYTVRDSRNPLIRLRHLLPRKTAGEKGSRWESHRSTI
jgi:hypothetical protein